MTDRGNPLPAAGSAPQPRELDGDTVRLLQLHDRRADWAPELPAGPWIAEAWTKLAWRDESTGYDCIMRRETHGELGGFVGVDARHPLFGYGYRALVTFDLKVHGGVTYSRACEEKGLEHQRICHVGEGITSDTLWWFGFAATHDDDLLPSRADGLPAGEIAARYRNEHYVYRQTLQLAEQLHAIAKGEEPPPLRIAPPPLGIGHDPIEEGLL